MIDPVSEVKRLDKALFATIAGNASGKAQEAFWARENLRNALDLIQGHWQPTSEDAPKLTGIPEFYRESVKEAYRILGAPVPRRVPLPAGH